MSDTPRTDRCMKNCNGWHHAPIETARELERELTAANARIAQLESELEAHAWTISQAMAQARIDQMAKQISELEKAGDSTCELLSFCIGDSEDDMWANSLSEQRKFRCREEICNWTKAKESKP